MAWSYDLLLLGGVQRNFSEGKQIILVLKGETMRALNHVGVGIAILSLVILIQACATVPPSPQVKASVLAREGDIVHLFHGGNKVAKEEFCLNEVVPVYRYFGKRYKTASEVGKIKITGYVGDHYLEGVVVKGNIKDDDVAVKPNSACIVRLPEPDR